MHRYPNILLLICLSVLLSCSSDTFTVKKYTIGFSQCCGDPWRVIMEKEMYRELAFHEDFELIILQAGNNSTQQISQISELKKMGVDLLIIAPNEMEPLTPIVEEVYESGIPVVLIDRKTQSENYTAFLGADNYEIGQTALHYLANRFEGKASIIELALPQDISPGIERREGFEDALQNYPGMDLLTLLEVEQLEKLEEAFVPVLKQYPEANIIYAHTDLIAKTAYDIAYRQDKENHLFFVGVDGIPGKGQGIEAVEEGILDVSFLYPTGGEEAIRLAVDILTHEPFLKENKLETLAIDASNVRIMRLQSERILKGQADIKRQQKRIEEQRKIYRNQQTALLIIALSLILSLILIGITWRSLRIVKVKNREISAQRDRILTMSEQAKKTAESMFSFFTNIAHEFKTPLTLIFGSVEDLLGTSSLDNSHRKDAYLIRKNASRLLVLINQLMDFRKIEKKRMRIQASENDIVAFIRGIMLSYRKIANNRKIDFQLFSNYDTFLLWFDTNMMDKILFNLLSNAFKFTPDGGRIYIKIDHMDGADSLTISVEDSGKGMNTEEIKKVFDRFYQSQNFNKGTGLGLSLSRELTHLHKGEIKVSSERNKGSIFSLKFPLGKSHFKSDEILELPNKAFDHIDYTIFELDEIFPSHVKEYQSSQDLSLGKQLKESTILLIDDNPELITYIRKKLNDQYHIEEASDGISGWEKVMKLTPDLVVSDVLMPGLPGIELAQKIKSDMRTSHIPIILLTGRSSMEHQIEGIQSGADAYITKPFSIELLSEKIKNLLFNRQALKTYYTQGTSSQESVSLNSLDNQFVERFIKIVNQHYSNSNFGVNELCKELGFSRSQLYRKVKVLFGQTVIDYIQQVRLEAAKKLLSQEELSVSEIAYDVGYNSPDYFSTAFKGRYGKSPTQFREEENNI